MRTPEEFISLSQSALLAVRSEAPLVQCITNSVVVNFTANVLLALGASPAMVDIPEEAEPFARVASGLLLNLGTPTAEHRQAMLRAVAGASSAGTPWVIDPVAIGSLPVRTELAMRLRELKPDVIRGNASEIIALAGNGPGGRGVDAAHGVEAALPAATELAAGDSVVAISGPIDLIVGGQYRVRIANGTDLLTKVTGGGCALGAVIAAFAATSEDQLSTTVAAVTVYTVAAEIAAERAAGPGSFALAFLDELSALRPEDLSERARIQVERVTR
ncbi:hydroxyethylthiazole kinase [Psychromicrobium sp. YIM B11713]|uniref:hydroxyethylthiazole kinase n=1 Tax=Psychromicrobium sp. YIM B11713 TaxID=3145233 RepID=UPI00374E5AB3